MINTNATGSFTGGSDDVLEFDLCQRLRIDNLFKFRQLRISMKGKLQDLIEGLESIIGTKTKYTIPGSTRLFIMFERYVIAVFGLNKVFQDIDRSLNLVVYGPLDDMERVVDEIKRIYPKNKSKSIDWFYAADNKPQRTIIDLEHPHQAKDEYFPWLKTGLENFQKEFLNSSANVLLLIGEPGCGKTSFIRDLIQRNDVSAAVTYDETLMNMDSFFIEFISKPYDLLIIEDADAILQKRLDGNKVMSKLLNAGDGLIKTKKKIIFTANLTNLDDVDEALTRPGRCFETLIFRQLTFSETQAAAAAAGLPEPNEAKTLASLFQTGPTEKAQTDHFGFNLSRT